MDDTGYSPCSLIKIIINVRYYKSFKHCEEVKKNLNEDKIYYDLISIWQRQNNYNNDKKTDKLEMLGGSYKEVFFKHKDYIDNIMILNDFIKEFISILSHKQYYENLVQNYFKMFCDNMNIKYKNCSIINIDKIE